MRVSIIGSGIVGQATGVGLALNGNEVLFHDIDASKLLALKSKGYNVTSDIIEASSDSEVLFVCVPTPTVNEKIDLNFVLECAKTIGEVLAQTGKYTVVTFRSTIPPQTTRTKLIPCLESYSNLKAGEDFGVCMNPEFLREQTPLKDFLNPCRIVIGEFDEKSGDVLKNLYSQLKCPLIRTDLETAEMIKYVSNAYLAAKISFFNEMYLICQKLGLDSNIIGQTVALDPRIGSYGVIGGKPFGGMCLPKDLAAFIDFANSKGLLLKLLPAIAEVNQEINLIYLMKKELQLGREQIC